MTLQDIAGPLPPELEAALQLMYEQLQVRDAEIERLRAQLPDGMQHCTIRFLQCEKGHGWLTATNWVQHGCPTCERDELQESLRLIVADDDEGDGCGYTHKAYRIARAALEPKPAD